MPKPGHNAPAQHEKTIMLCTAGKENSTATPVIANQCAHWCGNPFPFSGQRRPVVLGTAGLENTDTGSGADEL